MSQRWISPMLHARHLAWSWIDRALKTLLGHVPMRIKSHASNWVPAQWRADRASLFGHEPTRIKSHSTCSATWLVKSWQGTKDFAHHGPTSIKSHTPIGIITQCRTQMLDHGLAHFQGGHRPKLSNFLCPNFTQSALGGSVGPDNLARHSNSNALPIEYRAQAWSPFNIKDSLK